MSRRPAKQKTRKSSIPLDDALRRLLLYGESARGSSTWRLYTSRHFGVEDLFPAWEEHRAALMAEWRNSGESGLPWVVQFLEKRGQ